MAGLAAEAPGLDPGEILLGELNCVACHPAPPRIRARLNSKPGPLLGQVATRARPEFLQRWLLDPADAKPGTTMPDVLPGQTEPERAALADELVHYLVSLAPGGVPDEVPANRIAVEQGRVLFHRVGCVACHAPLEPAATLVSGSTGPTDADTVRFVLDQLEQTSVPLGNLAMKYTRASLERFLRDPLAVRPHGRMPSLNLTPPESRAIATYLIDGHAASNAPDARTTTRFKLDRRLARAGRARFESIGCKACHALAAGEPATTQPVPAPSLTALRTDVARGCLAENPPTKAPRYRLSPSQRAALSQTLRVVAMLAEPLPPADEVTRTLARLNCFGCHSRDGIGGPSPSRGDYFASLSEADLGDEGRWPPHLSAVGDKLRPEWLAQVLTHRAAVRPYLAVRMPQFGTENVGTLPTLLAAADAVARPPLPEARGELEAGRMLAGTNGLSCITCHRFGPYPALGSSVMDLAQAARRLQRSWFHRYLLDPASLRPGTRMPMFWPEGTATLRTVLDGDTPGQLESLWRYLNSDGDVPPPDGVPPPDQPTAPQP